MVAYRDDPRYLAIGRIARPWGVRGELKVEILTEDPSRFDELETVFVGPQFESYRLESARLHGKAMRLKLAGCDDRASAEPLRGLLLHVVMEDALPLEEGEYWVHQILGLRAYSTNGDCLGIVQAVLETGSNDIYVVRAQSGREVLVPALKDVVLEIDPDSGRMLVELPEGLI